MKKVRKTVSLIIAAWILTAQLMMAPFAALPVQAAPVTFPDGTVFDPEYYAQTYPDVKAAFGNDALKLWQHYYQFGRAEGRSGAPSASVRKSGTASVAAKPAAAAVFDPVFYANRYPDLKAAFGMDAAKLWQHYRMFGEKEGRQAAPNAVPGVTSITAPAGTATLPVPNPAAAKQAPAATTPAVIKSNGNRVAFIGDSITTFGGSLPPGYEPFYPQKGLESLAETWWYQVSARKGLQIVVNASYSRSRVTGDRNDPTGFCASSHARVNTVAAQLPDIVFIMMGTNDFTAGVHPANFRDAYLTLVTRLRAALPNATIICCTCIPEHFKWKNAQDLTIDAYNQEIRTVAAQSGCVLIDTYACGITKDQMMDGLHPDAAGAAVMANFIVAHMPQIKKK